MTERIEQAAIRHDGQVYTLPRPARHGDLFKGYSTVVNGIIRSPLLGGEQGFVTDAGRFVNRYEGWTLAAAADQIIEQPDGGKRLGPQLYTEDLW